MKWLINLTLTLTLNHTFTVTKKSKPAHHHLVFALYNIQSINTMLLSHIRRHLRNDVGLDLHCDKLQNGKIAE